MDIWQDRIRGHAVDQHAEDGMTGEISATYTACAWLILYSIVIASPLVLGSGQYKTSVVAAAPASLEHSQ